MIKENLYWILLGIAAGILIYLGTNTFFNEKIISKPTKFGPGTLF